MLNRMSIREKRKLRNLIVSAMLIFAVWFFFSPWGYFKYYRITNELEDLKKANSEIELKNQTLEKEIERLKNDPAYIEKVAREKFGLVKKNELVFDFSTKK